MDSLKGSMSDLMSQFHERMSKFEAELNKTPNTTTSSPDSLAVEYASFKALVLESLSCLQHQLEALARDTDALEMRSRRKMLIIHGVAELSKEETAQVVSQVMRDKLKMETFSVAAIRRCHRMGRQNNSGKPRPILVKFHDVDIRDKIWYTKTKLKGSGITLSEFLTRSRHQVFMAARERFGVTNCWTKQGYIYVLGVDGSKYRVVTHSELNAIGGPELNSDKQVDDEQAPTAIAPRKRRAAAIKK